MSQSIYTATECPLLPDALLCDLRHMLIKKEIYSTTVCPLLPDIFHSWIKTADCASYVIEVRHSLLLYLIVVLHHQPLSYRSFI